MSQETVLIIGDSPFISTVEDKLQYAIERYYSIGINNIIKKFPTNAHIFQDLPFINLTNLYKDMKTITLATYGDAIQKDNKELFDSYPFDFRIYNENDICRDGRLAWFGFTHDYAISYCIHKGFKRIILIGAADFTKGKHFMTEDEFNPSQTLADFSKKYIAEVCTKRADILTCNPESSLEIPRISIDELLV